MISSQGFDSFQRAPAVSEERRLELLQKLKLERALRKQAVQQGQNAQLIIDRDIVHNPVRTIDNFHHHQESSPGNRDKQWRSFDSVEREDTHERQRAEIIRRFYEQQMEEEQQIKRRSDGAEAVNIRKQETQTQVPSSNKRMQQTSARSSASKRDQPQPMQQGREVLGSGTRVRSVDTKDAQEQQGIDQALQQRTRRRLSAHEKRAAWQRLLVDKQQIYAERESQREQAEEVRLAAECPFQPTLSENSERILLIRAQNRYESVQERLLRQGEEAQYRLEQQRAEKRASEEEGEEKYKKLRETSVDSFQQKALYGRVQHRRPIHERYAEVLKKKQQNIERLKAEVERDANAYFKPQICRNSQVIAEILRSEPDSDEGREKDKFDRLYRQTEEIERRRMAKQRQSDEEQCAECSFQPTMLNTEKENARYLANIPLYSVDGVDFAQRQKIVNEFYEQKRKAREIEEQARLGDFHPRVDKISEMLANVEQKRDAKAVGIRLYAENEKRAQKRAQHEKLCHSSISFHPEINAKSREIVQQSNKSQTCRSVQEHAQMLHGFDRKQQAKLAAKREEQRVAELKECSFHPSTALGSARILYEQVEARYDAPFKQGNSEKAKKLQKICESNVLKECTFKPQLNQGARIKQRTQTNKLLKKVPGVEAFLLNQDKSEKIKNEKKLIEKKIFGFAERYDYAEHEKETVAHPFQLSQSRKDIKQKKIL